MKNKENFKTVDWVRTVRDNNYSKYKNLNLQQFASELSKEAKKSILWGKITRKKSLIK